MKILEKQSSVLTNYEVLKIIQEQEAEYNGTDGTGRARAMPKNFKRILTDVTSELTRPTSPLAPPTKYRNSAIKNLYYRTQEAGFQLEKGEYLQVINLRPKTLADLDIICEELDARFDEERQNELLGIVRDCLGPVEGEEDGVGGEEEKGTDWGNDHNRDGGKVLENGVDGMDGHA